MNAYGIPYVCSVCDGHALVRYTDARHLFRSDFVHSDPAVCRQVLLERKKQLIEREVAVGVSHA